jgi:(4S)-4-hydroxy-5-phosphonooxypentane-2,3-dione isomerase
MRRRYRTGSLPETLYPVERMMERMTPNATSPLLVVQVFAQVKPECVDAFRAATLDNASHSICEPGVARFDVLQDAGDPTRFTLIEAYRTSDAPAAHKATAHYARWRDTVEPMMALARHSVKYTSVFLPD